ncbi:MAG: hypothetical protein RL077_4192, partial [Verrucomicrobiota bacterium]
MRFFIFSFFGWAILATAGHGAAPAAPAQGAGSSLVAPKLAPPSEPVWEMPLASFDEVTYDRQVEKMVATFEQATGKKLV